MIDGRFFLNSWTLLASLNPVYEIDTKQAQR